MARPTADGRLRIIVLGYIVRGPVGGMAWCDLNYLAGLLDLGHDVYFVEDSGESPWCCYDPSRHTTDADPTYGLAFAANALAAIGFGSRWAYYDAHRDRWFGPCADRVLELGRTADVLLNLSGVNPLRAWFMTIPVRAFVDKDPVFTQLKHRHDPSAMDLARRHTAFFTFAVNLNAHGSELPIDGLTWRATRHPIFLEAWPFQPDAHNGRFTTVMQWNSYRAAEHQGVRYGMKSDAFEPFLDLPRRVGERLEMAVGSSAAPRARLADHGWIVRDPLEAASLPDEYQQYIRHSKAEFTVAKHGYVVSQCGWFSERSASYLASGRPVVTQETGFSRWLDVEGGVVPFTTLDEAVAAIEDVSADYHRHRRLARDIAVQYFDSRTVLPHLLDRALSTRSEP